MNNISIISPLKIPKNAKFGFFSPSAPIYPRRIEFIKMGLSILDKWGFETEVISEQMYCDWSVLRSVQERVGEFHNKQLTSDLDVLLATWGAKNSNDLIGFLDYKLILARRKAIIGSGDICVLLNAVTARTGLITYYGSNLGKLNQTHEIGFPLLLESTVNTIDLLPGAYKNNIRVVRAGRCNGRLVGGSLGSFTLGLSGTEYIPKYKETIFFFESTSLDYFRIRQHLQNLNNTKFLDNVKGVIIGATTQVTGEIEVECERMYLEFFSSEIPIIKTDIFGHGFYFNPTFPIGSMVTLDTYKHKYEIETE